MTHNERNHGKCCLYTFVGGLPYSCENHELESFMSQFGHITEVFIARDPVSQNHKGYAFVVYSQVHDLKTLFGAHLFKGKNIEVKRNMHNQALLTGLSNDTNEQDIKSAIEAVGYSVAEIIVGCEGNGVPLGSACVRLQNDQLLHEFMSRVSILVKDRNIEINSRSARKNVHPIPCTPKDQAAGRKPKNARKYQQDSAERRIATRGGPLGISNSGISFDTIGDQDSQIGFYQSLARGSQVDSEHSTQDQSYLPDIGVQAEVKARKLSSSLKTASKEYHPSPSKPSSFATLGDELFFDDESKGVLFTGRHSSEGVAGSPEPNSEGILSRRLSSYSSCFYTGSVPVQNEVRISFYTFPGRD